MKEHSNRFWRNKWNEKFDSYEEGLKSTAKHISDSDILEHLEEYIAYDDIFKWVITLPEFHNKFYKEIENLKNEWADCRLKEIIK